jgi:4'-phosphopantetheinyl transferase
MLVISLKDVPHSEHHSHAHSLLNSCLKIIGISPDSATLKGSYGKPYLADYPHIHYNITHANGIAACIVAKSECGIDAEKIRPYRPNVVKRAFSSSEKEMIENSPESKRDMLFFRLWTLKESFVKTIGVGISYPMNTVEFSFSGDEIISSADGYRFRQYIIDDRFVVAICETSVSDKEKNL